jgi:hypothetical protein
VKKLQQIQFAPGARRPLSKARLSLKKRPDLEKKLESLGIEVESHQLIVPTNYFCRGQIQGFFERRFEPVVAAT